MDCKTRKLYASCLVAVALVGSPKGGLAQVEEAWARRLPQDEPGDHRAVALCPDGLGGVYVVGRTPPDRPGGGNDTDWLTVKYDSDGDKVWASRYNGPGNGGDVPFGVAVDTDGDLYVAGNTTSDSEGPGNDDVTVNRYSPDGTLLWTRSYDRDNRDQFRAMALGRGGSVYVVVKTAHSAPPGGVIVGAELLSYDRDGNLLWSRPLETTPSGALAELDVDREGNVYVVQTRWADPQAETTELLLFKYGADGSSLWSLVYKIDGSLRGAGLALDAGGGIHLARRNKQLGAAVVETVKHDRNGNFVWSDRHVLSEVVGACDIGGGPWIPPIAVDTLGTVYVGVDESDRGVVLIYDGSSGNLLREYDMAQEVGHACFDTLYDPPFVQVDDTDNVYFASLILAFPFEDDVAVWLTSKHSPGGDLQWKVQKEWPGNGVGHRPRGMAVDSIGNVFLLSDDDNGYATIKYTQTFPPNPFLRGDCNGDGQVTTDVTDAVFLLNYNFRGEQRPPCLAACDANGDGKAEGRVTDAVYLLYHNFRAGPVPPEPFPECGPGTERDAALGCETPPDCQ